MSEQARTPPTRAKRKAERMAAREHMKFLLEAQVRDRKRCVEMFPGSYGDTYRRELLRLTKRALAAVVSE